jgi:thiol-disulfide isomerase/thioredoxin
LFFLSSSFSSVVTGEQLEMMLTEWDTPLVIDAYATWCGPCLLMSPEFEAAAKDLEGKVRFVKLDTDREEAMATRLAINGLPTLLFLDKYTPPKGEEEEMSEEQQAATAVLKGRIEGALRRDDIISMCEHYFFDGPEPKIS